MNIIQMGIQAGLCDEEGRDDNSIIIESHLKRFAALVAAQEREACAKLCEAEADDGTEGEWDGCCLSLANKIRARGTT